MNDPSQDPYFTFTEYPYFTADSAHTTCAEMGGTVPSVRLQHEEIWLETVIEYLSSMVRFNRPYTLKYMSWPVSESCDINDEDYISFKIDEKQLVNIRITLPL